MSPPHRWFLAAALLVATLSWFAVSNAQRSRPGRWSLWPHLEATESGARADGGQAVDLEARWVGRGVVVKHRPTDARSRFAARLGSDGAWTSDPADEAASSAQPAPVP